MPLKNGRLTHKEKSFVAQMARTNDPHHSARKAGFTAVNQAVSHLTRDPRVVAEIEATRDKLRREGAEIGVGVLIELASDKKQPPGVRRAAASDLVKYSGIAASEDGKTKELHEMTAEELTQHIARGMARLAEAKRPQLELQASPETPETGVFD